MIDDPEGPDGNDCPDISDGPSGHEGRQCLDGIAASICSTSTSLFIVVSLGIHCMFEIYPQNGHEGGVDGLNT